MLGTKWNNNSNICALETPHPHQYQQYLVA